MRCRFFKINFNIFLITCSFHICFFHSANGQIFFETFGNTAIGVCDQGTLANGFVTSNGVWNVINFGINDSAANEWYISATEPGLTVNSCSTPGCHTNPVFTDKTLHIGNVSNSPNASIICPSGDCGAIYDPGGFQNAVQTNKRVESPSFLLQGVSSYVLQFNYIEMGDDSNNLDNMVVEFYDGNLWVPTIADPPKTNTCGAGLASWQKHTVLLPAMPTSSNVKLGFRWINDNGGIGVSPSVAIDSIIVYEALVPAAYITVSDTQVCENDCIDFYALSVGPVANYTWTFSGASISSSTLQNPTSVCYSNPGTYLVTLLAATPGGVDFDSIFIEVATCTGISNPDNNLNQIKIFPNPASSIITISSGEKFINNFEISFYDLTGRLLMTRKSSSINDTIVDVSALRNGAYILKVQDGDEYYFADEILIFREE